MELQQLFQLYVGTAVYEKNHILWEITTSIGYLINRYTAQHYVPHVVWLLNSQ